MAFLLGFCLYQMITNEAYIWYAIQYYEMDAESILQVRTQLFFMGILTTIYCIILSIAATILYLAEWYGHKFIRAKRLNRYNRTHKNI